MKLHDHWLDVTRKTHRKASQLAAQYAGFTSSRVLEPGSPMKPAVPLSAPVLPETAPVQEPNIPEFEAFDMEHR